jgi:predicted RNA-binding Zn-ribbon protein involved in translation (DUF1610 family)
MPSIRRILTIACIAGLLASLSCWALSYLHCSRYSQSLSYGFCDGTFQWRSETPGSNAWMGNALVPRELVMGGVLFSHFADGPGLSIILKPGVTRRCLKPWDPSQRCVRIDNRWTVYGYVDLTTCWTPTFRQRCIVLPLWLPTVLFAVPLIGLYLWRTRTLRKRRAHGLCPTCGYDLTGNVTGVCPECGSTLPASFTAKPPPATVSA